MKRTNEAMCVLTEEHSAAEQRNYTGSFCGFVLLKTEAYDLTALRLRLQQRWGIVPAAAPEEDFTVEGGQQGDWLEELLAEENVNVLTEPEVHDGNLVFDIPGALVVIGYVPAPVPEGEAERFAANNYLWPEAVEVTRQHTAHLMVAVMPRELAPLEAGKTYVKIISSCLETDNAIGIYTAGTVFAPDFYQDVTAQMEQGVLPVLNLVQLGVYQNEAGNNGYTIGLDSFGKDELEILGSTQTPQEIRALLYDVVQYILQDDVTLRSGTTLSLATGQSLSFQRGDGVAVEGHSIQIRCV